MSDVKVRVDYDTEMLEVYVDGENVFYGNFWDFNRPHDLIDLLSTISSVKLHVEEYEYHD